MKRIANVLLTILGTIFVICGAYFMGNYVLDTFNDNLVEQIMSSLFGMLLWGCIISFIVIIYGIYRGIEMLTEE